MRMPLLICMMLWLLASLVNAQTWSPERFDDQIAPLLAQHCFACHRGQDAEGGLDLSRKETAMRGGESGPAVVAHSLAKSLLWERIESGEMPPEANLPESDKAAFGDWIESGARWGTDPIDLFRKTTEWRAGWDWWSLQPIRRPTIPQVAGAANPIDAFVRQRLSEHGLTMSPRAAPLEIVRRLHFDLIGLPPGPEEVRVFSEMMRRDSEQAVEVLIDRLLASQHFGERWARHWLDVVRFGESQGFERDRIRNNSWHYRDWVINAFNTDMPYDEFVRQQLAGDVMVDADADSVIATGFLVAGAWDEVGQKQQSAAMKAVVRQDEMEDYVGTIGQAFLGLTINCARCHDHKFDPITQEEYYRVSASLAGVHHGSRDVQAANQQTRNVYAANPSKPQATYLLARGNPAAKVHEVLPGGIAALSGVDADFHVPAEATDADRRQQLAAWITDRHNPLFARVIVNRLWHYHFGAGIVATPNDFGFSGGRPSHPELLDFLAAELIDSEYSLKHLHRLIVSSDTYLQASRSREEGVRVDAKNRLLWRKAPLRLDAEVLRDSILQVSGQFNPRFGGVPYQDFKTHVDNTQFYEMVDKDSPDVYRRTIYRTWVRSGRSHLLDVFDCPDPSTTAPKRSVTTTPLQALTLMNHSFVLRMADRFAERVQSEVGQHADEQVARVFALVYGREPQSQERVIAVRFVDSHGLSALCRVVFNSNEFIHVD